MEMEHERFIKNSLKENGGVEASFENFETLVILGPRLILAGLVFCSRTKKKYISYFVILLSKYVKWAIRDKCKFSDACPKNTTKYGLFESIFFFVPFITITFILQKFNFVLIIYCN